MTLFRLHRHIDGLGAARRPATLKDVFNEVWPHEDLSVPLVVADETGRSVSALNVRLMRTSLRYYPYEAANDVTRSEDVLL